MQAVLDRRDALIGALELSFPQIKFGQLWYPCTILFLHFALLYKWQHDVWVLGSSITTWWPMPLALTVLYITLTHLSMRLMEEQPAHPGAVEWLLVFNIHQLVFYGWLSFAITSEAVGSGMSIWGNRYNPDLVSGTGVRLATLIWIHYYSKLVDMFDTMFVVMRKKTTQLTFLHVYQKILWIWSVHFCFSC
jgi:hypothetical protein